MDSTLRAGDPDLSGEILHLQLCLAHNRKRINIVSPHPIIYSQPNLEGEFSLDSIGIKNNHEQLYRYGESPMDPLEEEHGF